MIDALLPPGAIWTPKDGGGLDALLDGLAANNGFTIDFLSGLAHIRNPYKTVMLYDMEKEYGIRRNVLKTEDERRKSLAAAIYDRVSDGALSTMQAKLDQAGFNVFVHENDPPVDPITFISDGFSDFFGRPTDLFGREDAFFGQANPGELFVNGNLFPYESSYAIPEDAGYWPLFFFVGGESLRNETTGALEQIALGSIPVARRDEFKRIILKYKPLHTWCGLTLQFV